MEVDVKARGKKWVDMLEASDKSEDDLMEEEDSAEEKSKAEQRTRRRRFNLKRLIRVLHICKPPNHVMAILGKR